MATVYVVIEWRDYRKENYATVHSVHRNRSTAQEKMQNLVNDLITRGWAKKKDIVRDESGNCIEIGDYDKTTFEVIEKPLDD